MYHADFFGGIIARLAGFKVPIKSTSELATAIEKLILNPELVRKMRSRSRQKAEREFDVYKVVEKHLLIYGVNLLCVFFSL